MKTIVYEVNPQQVDLAVMEKAADVLRQGGLVAFPTETVYGLGANGLDAAACKKIYEAKGRPSDNPLILHIASLSQLDQIVSQVPEMAKKLMDAFWPGPMTLILPKKDCVPLSVTGGLDTVGVRFPSHPVAQALIRAAALPIAAPSANVSGKPSPTKASHVLFDMDGKIDVIVDGGAADVGLESTIIDATGPEAVILRPGAITLEMVQSLLGSASVDPAVLGKGDEKAVPKAPGMKYTHYSPKAPVTLVQGETQKVVQAINTLVKEAHLQGKKVGVLATEETKDIYEADFVLSAGAREDEKTIGARLFAILRKLDYLGADVIYSEVFAESGEGLAIMNRLKKAAGYEVIEVK